MKRILFSIAMIAALASCTQEPELTTKDSSKVQASAADFQCDEAFTRTTITQSGSSAPTFAWKAGDVIGVIPMDGKTVQSNYEISKIDSDPKTATFDGGVWALKEGKGYAAYYPMKPEFVMSGGKLEFSFLGQTQTANNSLEHISAYDYMYAPAVTASSSTTAFNFSHLVSLVRVQVTVPQADEYTSLVLESSAAWFAGKAELSLADGTMTSTQSLKSCTIALDNISVSAGGVLTVWFATLPTSALDGGSLTAKLYGKNTLSTIDITGLKTFEAGKAYSFSCSASSPSAGGMEYVDLGLSVKWAKCNLGACNPEEYGDYYAWGDIETYYEDGYAQESSQKHWKEGKSGGYSINNYKFYKIETIKYEQDVYDGDGFLIHKAGDEITSRGYTKYMPKSKASSYGFKGFFDTLTQLELSDDVAHVKLGGKWRMPTDNEFTALRNNCTWQWGTYKGVNGYKVTSKKEGYTDKWIFLPAAGYRNGTYLNYAGSRGYYWSSSLDTFDPYRACSVYFDSGDVLRNGDYRYYGLSVRPVSE